MATYEAELDCKSHKLYKSSKISVPFLKNFFVTALNSYGMNLGHLAFGRQNFFFVFLFQLVFFYSPR